MPNPPDIDAEEQMEGEHYACFIVGPYTIEHDAPDALPDHVVISAPNHGAFAQVVWRMSDETRSPQCEGTAQLLSLAPELLEALEYLVFRIERTTVRLDLREAKRAIALARKRT